MAMGGDLLASALAGIAFIGCAMTGAAPTAEAGPRQAMMGTDYPYPWTSISVDHILSTPGLSDSDKTAIPGGTAAELLGIGR